MKKNSLNHEQNVLQSLVNSAHAFLKFQNFNESARFAYDCCKNLIGSTAGYVALLSADKSQNELLFLDMGNLQCTLNPEQPMPIRGFRANAYSAGQVVYENDFQQSKWLQYLPDGHGKLNNVMFAPLVIDNESVGIFVFANKLGGFCENDTLIAKAFAKITAIALLQKRTLENSETNARHLNALMQSAHDAIITIDQQGVIIFWNQAAERIFGYRSAEIVGKSCQKIIPELFQKKHDEAFSHAFNAGVSKLSGQIIEVKALRKNNETFSAELSLSKWAERDSFFFTGILRDITSNIKMKKDVQKSEALFRTVFETTPDPININNLKDGKFIKVNDRFLELTGYERNEVIGKTALDLNIWHDLDRRKQFFSKLYREGQVRDFEASFICKDGSMIIAQISSEIISYKNAPHLVAVTKDITELIKAEKNLQAAHEKLQSKYQIRSAELKRSQINYQMVADYTYDWEWWTNLDGTYRYVSPACKRITGYEAQQFIEDKSFLREIIIPEDRELWDNHRKESHKDIGLRELQFRIRRSDGEVCWIEHACQPVFTEDDEFQGFRASNRDITARKLAEQKLQTSEENLSKAQEVAYIGSWDLDLLSNNLIWSDESYRLFGIPKGTPMTYKKFLKTVHPEDRDYVNKKWDAAIKGEPYDIEHRILVNNEIKWVREKAELKFDGKGNPISGVGIAQDITKRKMAEIARQKTEKELRVLSAQLLSAEERERKRIAGDIHDSIGQVLSAIKFSVENSLTAISNESVSSAVEMLENLIPLSQKSIEEVRRIIMDLRPSTLDDLGLLATISWFCREFESIYTKIRIHKEIHIDETDIPSTLKTVIYRIMQEALNNAAKHSQTDIIRLHLMKNSDELELLVEDTGVGFSLDDVQSRSINQKGMGLGSMKERTQLSGGNFTIRSSHGVGTRITVSWPLN